ncbi:MAG: sigma-70 family RNA polymerase sigma factor [Kiritimatiellae bacterium]|nr:sigma-70 family RNA polymerase sigma factor [Kiritimatiellia bacterium]
MRYSRPMEDGNDPDRVWVERSQQGDRAAYTKLVERYQTPLYQFAFRLLNDAALAQDVAQEALARGWLKRASFRWRHNARFSTWLFQLARNAAIDLIRRRRELSLDAVAHEPISPALDAAGAAQDKELGARIAAAFAALPEAQRTATTLSEFHGMSAREIAIVLHCSTRSAESHLYRGKQALRVALADCWTDLHAR